MSGGMGRAGHGRGCGTRGGSREEGDFGVFRGLAGEKRSGRVFSFFVFFGGRSVAGQVFVLVCVKKEAAPLLWVLVGGDGVRRGYLVSVVCGEHGRDACVGCSGRRGQDVHGAWSIREARRWRREEKGPVVCVPAP